MLGGIARRVWRETTTSEEREGTHRVVDELIHWGNSRSTGDSNTLLKDRGLVRELGERSLEEREKEARDDQLDLDEGLERLERD